MDGDGPRPSRLGDGDPDKVRRLGRGAACGDGLEGEQPPGGRGQDEVGLALRPPRGLPEFLPLRAVRASPCLSGDPRGTTRTAVRTPARGCSQRSWVQVLPGDKRSCPGQAASLPR